MELEERMNLTDIEKTFLSYDRKSPSNVAAVAHLEGIQDVDMLEKALNIAKNRHPYLQYFIEQDGDHSVFFYDPMKPVPLTVFQEAEEDLWIKICEDEINRVFVIKNAPMMKAYFLQEENGNSELIVSFSHIIADGINAVQFVKDVIYLLEKMIEGDETPTIDKLHLLRPDTVYFTKSDLVNQFMSIGQFEKDHFIIQSFLPDSESTASNFGYPMGGSEKRSKMLPYHLSNEESGNLFDICRGKGITINSLLSVALILAMRDYIYDKGISDSPWIKISNALDLRRRMRSIRILPEDFGMWAGRSVLFSKVAKDTNKYHFCKSYHSIFSEYVQQCPFYYSNLMVQQFNEAFNSTTVKSPVQYYPNIKITNLGDLNRMGIMSRYGNLKINCISFATPLHREWMNDLGFGLCASGFDNRLILNFIYMEPARTEEEARLFVNRFFKHMNI